MQNLKRWTEKFKINRYFILLLLISIMTGVIKEVVILFFFVMVHELSHVLLAVVYKMRIESIELFPFGGVAKIDNLEGADASKEVMVAIAGPAINLISAATMLAFNKAGVYIPNYRYMMNVNITLALFNLLPGLPLDGGRMIRAILSYFVGFKKATSASIILGKAVAILLFACGLIAFLAEDISPYFLVMPVFIYISAVKEERSVMYTIMKNIIYKNRCISNKGSVELLEICTYEDTLASEMLKKFDLNKYHMIMVMDKELVVQGILTETEIINGLSSSGASITLGEIVKRLYK